MFNKKTIVLLTLVLNFLFGFPAIIFAGNQDYSKSKAIKLFEEENYYQAISQFETLLEENPEDTTLHYYLGAALTETGQYSEMVLNHLLKANNGETPLKINYYLGLQYQAQNNWTNALKHYNTYQLKASDEQRKELNIPEKIQQCFNQENPLTDYSPEINKTISQPVTETTTPPETTDSGSEISKIETVEAGSLFQQDNNGDSDYTDYPISFIIDNTISYYNTANFTNAEARKYFEKAQDLKNGLQFSLKEMERLREEYRATQNPEQRESIGGRILTFENESYELKEEINQLLQKARNLEYQYWQNASSQEIDSFLAKAALAGKRQKEITDNQEAGQPTQNMDIAIDPDLLLDETESSNLRASPAKKEDDLVYKIQIGAFSRGLPAYVDRLFKKLSLIRKIDNYTDEKGVVVYTTGNLRNLKDAESLKEQVRQEGAKDAFIVPYFKGKRITLEEAKKLEVEP